MLYVVTKGKTPGIYKDEELAKAQIEGVEGGEYKFCLTDETAREYLKAANVEIDEVHNTAVDKKIESKTSLEDAAYYVVIDGSNSEIYSNKAEAIIGAQCAGGAEIKAFNNKNEAELFRKTNGALDDDKENEIQYRDDSIIIYCDGSYCKENESISYAYLIIENNKIIQEEAKKIPKNEFYKSNNILGEIYAVQKALEYCCANKFNPNSKDKRHLVIISDLEGIGKWVSGEWTPKVDIAKLYVKNVEGVKKYFDIDFKHVKGHSKDPFNDRVDKKAKEAAKS